MSRGVISLRGHLLFMSHRFLQSITDWTQTAAAASNCTKNPSYCCCLLPPHYAIVPGPQTAAAQRRVSKSLCFQSQTRAAELGQQPAAWACVLTAPHSPPASSHTFTIDVVSAPCDQAPDTTAPLSGACTRLAALQHQHRFVAPVSVRAVSKCAVAGPSLGPAAWLTQLWIKVFVLLQPAGHLTGRQRGMGDSFRNKAHSLSATVVAPFIQTLVFLSRLCVGQIDGQYCILLRCRAYTTIITAEQRQKYKAEFNTYYAKYRKLHNVLDQVSKRFAHLESKLKHAQKGSEDFKVRTFDIFKYH